MPRAVVFTGAGEPLQVERFSRPEPRGAEILVRVACCTLCRSDLHTHAGRRTEPTPLVLGHEIVGHIEALGPQAPRLDMQGAPLEVGSRVSWSLTVGCGECFYCRENLPQKCQFLYKYGHERWTPPNPPVGGLSDLVLLAPGTTCHLIPEGIPDQVAASANCSTATVAAIVRRAGPVAGRAVAVFGAGVLGLTACAMARAAGAQTVLAIDPVAECRARALRFGATDALDFDEALAAHISQATAGRGPDIVLELAGTAATVQAGLAVARTGGTIVLAGAVAPVGNISFDPEQAVRRMHSIHGVHNYHPTDLAAGLRFLAEEGRDFPWRELVAAEYSLDEIEEAFAFAHAHRGVRVAIYPSLGRGRA